MSARSAPVLGVFGFLTARSIVNGARRRLARLREPRYLVGSIVGALYFYFYVFRFFFRDRGAWAPLSEGSPHLPAEAVSIALLLASAALALATASAWLLKAGTPRLSLTEADIQFLLPAPLPPRSVVHFALLRSQLGLVLSSLITGLVFLRGSSAHAWQRVLAYWIVLSVFHLHTLGLGFTKAALAEGSGRRSRSLKLAVTVAAALVTVVVLAWLVQGLRLVAAQVVSGADLSLSGLAGALSGWSDGWLPRILLAPFRALLAPAFSLEPERFLRVVPVSLALLVLHYLWVVRVTRRYEEAALEGARRRAELTARFQKGRLGSLPAESKRATVPFPLGPEGPPEVAVVWKNLIGPRRSNLRATLKWIVLSWVLLFVAAAVLTGPGTVASVVLPVTMAVGFFALPLSLMLPFGLQNDFRTDLEHASILRGWPLAPSRLVVAELLAPLIVSVVFIWTLLGAIVAILVGSLVAFAWQRADPSLSVAGPFGGLRIWAQGIPAVLGCAAFLPALMAAVLVVQNAAVLAFPAWFQPGQRRARGFEATGTRLIGFFATLVAVLFALIPAALLGGLVGWGTWGLVGPWALVPAGFAAALPVWAEVAAAIPLLARLFASFDVAAEALE